MVKVYITQAHQEMEGLIFSYLKNHMYNHFWWFTLTGKDMVNGKNYFALGYTIHSIQYFIYSYSRRLKVNALKIESIPNRKIITFFNIGGEKKKNNKTKISEIINIWEANFK